MALYKLMFSCTRLNFLTIQFELQKILFFLFSGKLDYFQSVFYTCLETNKWWWKVCYIEPLILVFWVITRCVVFIGLSFGAPCCFSLVRKCEWSMRWNQQGVLKRRPINITRRVDLEDGTKTCFETSAKNTIRRLINQKLDSFIQTRRKLELYKVVQIWPGLFVCKQVTVCPGHIWTTLYI
jgi:hypothetical protein